MAAQEQPSAEELAVFVASHSDNVDYLIPSELARIKHRVESFAGDIVPGWPSSVPASEHAFRIVKRLWGFAKVRYRGLLKNTARAFASFALANLYLVRKYIVPRQQTCFS